MDAFVINGGTRLQGHLRIDGSKNASLPMMAAALLTTHPVTLHNVPDLSDIRNMARLLGELGCTVTRDGLAITMQTQDESQVHARYDIVRTMRASICVLGPLLARRQEARVAMPGGCAFGHRPIDLHLKGLQGLGGELDLEGGDIVMRAAHLQGRTIFLGGQFGSSVLATANVMCAAVLGKGTTIIESAACEPEIVNLAELLIAMGAQISGAGSPRITINGVSELGGAEHAVIPDRIAAGTYAIAAGMTNGDVVLEGFPYDCLLAPINILEQVGIHIQPVKDEPNPSITDVRITSERRLSPAVISTQPFPGFPTDLQAQMMAILSLADGNSIITEKIFPERFMHVAELSRMGAQLIRQGPTVMIQGVRDLRGAPVMASDLRASACLVLAGMVAEGETTVSRVYHLDRGYAGMEQALNALGASIRRVNLEGP